MGRQSRLSKQRSKRLKDFWRIKKSQSPITVEAFQGKIPQRRCAVVVGPKVMGARSSRCAVLVPKPCNHAEDLDTSQQDQRERSTSITSAQSDLSAATDSESNNDLDTVQQSQASRRALRQEANGLLPKPQHQRSTIKPRPQVRKNSLLDHTEPSKCIYFRAWSTSASAGSNHVTHFQSSQQVQTFEGPDAIDSVDFLRTAATHINRIEEATPFISLTSSFLFALKFAIYLQSVNPDEPVYISAIDGDLLTQRHTIWRSPEVCQRLRERKWLKDWRYRGCFELLVLHEVSPECVISCNQLSHLLDLEQRSTTLRTFLQLKLLKQCRYGLRAFVRDLDKPAGLDCATGLAVGQLAGFMLRIEAPGKMMPVTVRQMTTILLEHFQIPDYDHWENDGDFVQAVIDGLHEYHRIKPALEPPSTPSVRPTRQGLLTPPRTSEKALNGKAQLEPVTYGPLGSQRNQVFRMGTMFGAKTSQHKTLPVREPRSTIEQPASLEQHGLAADIAVADDGENDWDMLSDVLSSDEDLHAFAEATRASDDDSVVTSKTLGRRRVRNLGISRSVPSGWQRAETDSPQAHVRQSRLKGWLFNGTG